MSDQKPVKRDAAWLAAVNALITEHMMAVISVYQKQIPAEVLFAKRQAIDAMLLAPDPRDACVDALRSIRVRGPDADGLYWLVIAPTSGGPQGALNLGPLSNIMVASAVARFNDMQSSALRALDGEQS